jgi:hypothetical protein
MKINYNIINKIGKERREKGDHLPSKQRFMQVPKQAVRT